MYARCYLKIKCSRWRAIVWGKKKHNSELECKARQKRIPFWNYSKKNARKSTEFFLTF